MSFGLQIINDAGLDIVQGSRNIFAVGNIHNPGSSGSQAFTLNAGESLVAIPELIHNAGQGRYLTGLSVSGNTVHWSVDGGVATDGIFHIVVYKTGVA
ncbi:MAG: hypothetical protein ACRC6V_00555 [Bacteroidales bacterium]